jgi:hypothetical protein
VDAAAWQVRIECSGNRSDKRARMRPDRDARAILLD